ncbi:MAG: hypothetical protein LLG06_03405 [Desulfobacteraceae bacterium]|nr:hypothetical protein [Desulfobacteraceae bacterium]
MRRYIFVLAITLLPIFLLTPLACAGNKAANKETLQSGELLLTATEGPGNGEYVLRFTKGENLIFKGECAFKVRGPKILTDTPRPSCRSLLAYCYSGGAHCCMTLLIATDCGETTSLNAVDLAHGDLEASLVNLSGTSRQIKVLDWQFAYYGPDGADVQLSFADSPGMTRLLVYDNGRWRADRLGEFGSFYSGLLRESMRSFKALRRKPDPERVAGKAIKTAYYSLMSGKSPEETAAILNRLLLDAWKPESERILKDIVAAVAAFDPVEVIR